MTEVYLRVKEEYDGRVFQAKSGAYVELIKRELITLPVVEKYNIPLHMLEVVRVDKENVYWSFGARFEIGNGYITSEEASDIETELLDRLA